MTRRMSPARRKRILAAHDHRCIDCGSTAGPFDIDHARALALLGDDEDANLRPLCRPCHKVKTANDAPIIAKAKREWRKQSLSPQAQAERARRAAKQPNIPQRRDPWQRGWKRKVNGTTERRR